MLFRLFIACCLLISATAFGQSKKGNAYNYTVDLTRVTNDRVYVELSPPSISESETIFYFPKIVPGTYAIADYGRYIAEFTAVDKKGNKLPIEKIDDNSYRIKDAKKLSKVTYWVDDTWDTTTTGPEIFWPAGTNIEEQKNFVINTSGFFGYFDGKKENPFQFNVVRSKDLYGSTGLIPSATGASPSSIKLEKTGDNQNKVVDVYKTSDYDQLVDSPLMYSKPDTALIKVANTEVLIGSYSPNNKITAKQIAASIREVLMAQKEYLGGKLPVDKYAFIFYFTDKPVLSYGALEHSYSSMYYMPEATIEEMNQQLRDFAAHEFFHIVTPLTVHSKEIDDFDFNDPKMSKHLWMYEGVTEYFAGNVQVKYGLITPEEYIGTLQEKMLTADQFKNDVPFTEISKFTLDKYHDQYYNVYQKGALIGLCLDIKLRKLSKGKYGLRNLMLDLSNKYGKNKAFEDDKLFEEITKMTYPEIGEFFNRYVNGTEPLPLQEVFSDVGIGYTPEETFEDYSLGIGNENVGVTQIDNKPKIQIASTAMMNAMGTALGFQEGDVLMKINGEEIPDLGPEFGPFIQKHIAALQTDSVLTYTVLRKDVNGENKTVELSAPVKKVQLSRRHNLEPLPSATEEQLALRDSWLKP
ncbi:peptidase M61 [Chryseosolibacter indicus]|uniref:Peptidase M61 n=1 Tax=Chryseosolibacter indicus TaxID=2782351 RepID=A0ABS5VPD9_9BACT|nr:peptidase M61 [Chryseosolibacter indicus]MBT1703278.1 peptidase M61 [Chryseosolibacter indicus]